MARSASAQGKEQPARVQPKPVLLKAQQQQESVLTQRLICAFAASSASVKVEAGSVQAWPAAGSADRQNWTAESAGRDGQARWTPCQIAVTQCHRGRNGGALG